MNDKTGGPAFPSPGIGTRQDDTQYQRDGMPLWDWYAGQFASGCSAYSSENAARYCSDFADAQMEERKKRGIA